MLCGCLGYAAFGNTARGNMLTGFGFYEPYWLIDFANLCIVVHLVGAYQHPVITGMRCRFSVNMFWLSWRTAFVNFSTVLSIVMPFFNDLLGAVGFWPLTVYYPVEMYIRQRQPADTEVHVQVGGAPDAQLTVLRS
ncbi:hypothetical protein GUJ93_ZPchr0012g19951 [Zizania palustris]|uniref:Amino acid transporter transmembrane domain-containing protein n=1 Tax=Zizania palustris TaxID=103762 RepID=A0A8J5WPM0_ZIZPA|nr:hypothetical protein GUJ93_ZPchr0012g19951 [Zizania palustris]